MRTTITQYKPMTKHISIEDSRMYIAELEAHAENLNRELLKRTCGGSEFYNEPYNCLKFIDGLISGHRISIVAELKRNVKELTQKLAKRENMQEEHLIKYIVKQGTGNYWAGNGKGVSTLQEAKLFDSYQSAVVDLTQCFGIGWHDRIGAGEGAKILRVEVSLKEGPEVYS